MEMSSIIHYAAVEFSTIRWPKGPYKGSWTTFSSIWKPADHNVLFALLCYISSARERIPTFQSAVAFPLREQSLHTGGLVYAQISCTFDLYETTESIL